ncbi:MAG: hypothetical protein AB8G14_16470 [Ilumatobacter sp.]
MNDRIPPDLRSRTKQPKAASGARILTAGLSVALGVGLVGAIAASTATAHQPVTPPAAPRVIIIEQPSATPLTMRPVTMPPMTTPPMTTAPTTATALPTPTTSQPTTTQPPQPLPTARVVQTEPAPAPVPVTVSEGS